MAELTPTTPIDRAELQRVASQLPKTIQGVDKPYDFGHEVRRVLFHFDSLEAAQERIAELEGALRGARSAAWHHRVKHSAYGRLLWVEAEAERLLQDGIGDDPILQRYYDEHRAALAPEES